MVEKINDYDPLEQLLKPFFIPRIVPVFLLRSLLEAIYHIEVNGIENIPRTGGGIIISNHKKNVLQYKLLKEVKKIL